MVHTLHLTEQEVETLTVAIDDHQDILRHALEESDMEFSDEQKDNLRHDQEVSEVIKEKLLLLTNYIVQLRNANSARNKAVHAKQQYMDFALRRAEPAEE